MDSHSLDSTCGLAFLLLVLLSIEGAVIFHLVEIILRGWRSGLTSSWLLLEVLLSAILRGGRGAIVRMMRSSIACQKRGGVLGAFSYVGIRLQRFAENLPWLCLMGMRPLLFSHQSFWTVLALI